MLGSGFVTKILAAIGLLVLLVLLAFVLFPGLWPWSQQEWQAAQPPRCATAQDCVLANNSCCSKNAETGNWSCAKLDVACAPNYAARVSGCWCGSGVCAANYSCEPLRPTPTVELPPFPPENLESSPSPGVESCVFDAAGHACCKGGECAGVEIDCVQGFEPLYSGCNENCEVISSCVPVGAGAVSPSPVGLANPASVNCIEKGGVSVIVDLRTPPFGQAGYCLFGNATLNCTQDDSYHNCVSVCDEWAFFRGECAPGDCALTCTAVGTRSEGWKDCSGTFLTYANCAP